LICAVLGTNTVTVLTNDGSGGFVLACSLDVGGGSQAITAADLNGDGKMDLILANWTANTLSVLLNTTAFPASSRPLITAQPTSKTNSVDVTVAFTVSATASGIEPARHFSYQWQLAGTNLLTATNNILFLTNLVLNQAGNYDAVISNYMGTVTSSIATLIVFKSPSITNQPQPLTVAYGHAASFVVEADGWPSLAYQWQFNGMNLPGATNTTLALAKAFPINAGIYTAIVTNLYGSVTSNPAMLTVLPLGITAPTMNASGKFQFSFETTTGVDYEVEYSTNLTQWFPLMTLGGIGLPLTLIDPNTAGSQQRFYRIVLSLP
jgi:hypothetical protein